MAEPSDLEAMELAAVDEPSAPLSLLDRRKQKEEARRSQALSLRQAGLTFEQIGDRLGISSIAANALITRALELHPAQNVDQFRALENARLDRAQAAIWAQVLEGDLKAVDTYLRISQARRRMNGLDAPMEVSLAISVRQEMESALAKLEETVLGNMVIGEVLHSEDHSWTPQP